MAQERNPNILPHPANEDNIGWIGYRNSAEGYLRLLLRLEDAAQNPNSRIFTIDNRTPETVPIRDRSSLGQVLDVSDVEVLGQPYVVLKTGNIREMLTRMAVPRASVSEYLLKISIGRVYPPIYLSSQRRHTTGSDRLKALFSEAIHEENRWLNWYYFANMNLRVKQYSIGLPMTLAYQGFLHLMAGIADETIEDSPSDSQRLLNLKAHVRKIDPELALVILEQALTVLTPQEQAYNLPAAYQN